MQFRHRLRHLRAHLDDNRIIRHLNFGSLRWQLFNSSSNRWLRSQNNFFHHLSGLTFITVWFVSRSRILISIHSTKFSRKTFAIFSTQCETFQIRSLKALSTSTHWFQAWYNLFLPLPPYFSCYPMSFPAKIPIISMLLIWYLVLLGDD